MLSTLLFNSVNCPIEKKLHTSLLSRGVSIFVFLAGLLISGWAHADKGPILAHQIYGSGPEKVLVTHSWIDNANSFDQAKRYFNSDIFTFVFADLRGYGGSKNIEGHYTAKEAADDVMRLADMLGWDRFHVIGHSMSGMIMQRLAIDDWTIGAKRVKSFIAVTPVSANGYPADADTQAFLKNMVHNRPTLEMGISGLSGGRLLPAWHRTVSEKNMATSRPDAMLGYYKMWVETDFSNEVKQAKMQTPMLVIGGRQDLPGFQEAQLRNTFVAWYPNVELQFITDAGHFPMYETPVYFASIVEKFLMKHIDTKS